MSETLIDVDLTKLPRVSREPDGSIPGNGLFVNELSGQEGGYHLFHRQDDGDEYVAISIIADPKSNTLHVTVARGRHGETDLTITGVEAA